MSKKDRKREQRESLNSGPTAEVQPRPDAVSAEPAAQVQQIGSEIPQQETGRPDYSRRYFLIFWILIFLAAGVAWILAIVWPGVSESLIERWMMAALAVSLAVFLFFYK